MINNIINTIDSIRKIEFEKNNYEYVEKIVVDTTEKNGNINDIRNFQADIRKKTMQENNKTKQNKRTTYIMDSGEGTMVGGESVAVKPVDIIKDDIFKNTTENEVSSSSESKLEITTMDGEGKLTLIKNYLYKKNIRLSPEDIQKITELVNNPDFSLRKYINISKMYQEITKITFIKKNSDGTYFFDEAELTKTKASTKKPKSFFK